MSLAFTQTSINGAYLINLDEIADERGFVARVWCAQQFKNRQLDAVISQCNLSYNKLKGTLRGLHYQNPPFAETKIVRCISGEIFDVIIDLRRGSPSYLQHFTVTLSAHNRVALYIPKGCAHGLQTIADNTEVLYFTTEFYHPDAEGLIRWNDPQFNIKWPMPVSSISDKDESANCWNQGN